MTRSARHLGACATALFWSCAAGAAFAGDSDVPAVPTAPPAVASPSPAPSPASRPRRFRVSYQSTASYVNQQFAGPGIAPPEARSFAAGLPTAPGTPYDLWTSSPNVTGYGVNHSLFVLPSYVVSPRYVLSATLGYGSISGNANVAAYWGDQTIPALNPHLGNLAAPVAFPTGNHGDPIAATAARVLSVSLARLDGRVVVHGGWFDLSQGEGFVVSQPAATNTPILFTEPLPEGIGDAPVALPAFAGGRTPLPLRGVDIVAKPRPSAGIELVDAALPGTAETPARLQSASVEVVRPGKVSFGAQVARVATAGRPVGAAVLFGAAPTVTRSDQGPLPASSLGAQRLTIAGVRADVPLFAHSSAQVSLGMSCYGAQGGMQAPGACAAGAFQSVRVQHAMPSFAVVLEAMRMDATYAPVILPYGTSQNTWSPAYSWPGTWLKGNYQLVDDATMGPNRAGFRLTTRATAGNVEARAAYASYEQLRPFDATTAYQAGFVEAYFLPQLDAAGTLGAERHAAFALKAHAGPTTVELDVTDVTLRRAASSADPEEAVAVANTGATMSLSRRFGANVIGSVGAARNAMFGTFNSAAKVNVDLAERVVFGSIQWTQSSNCSYAVQYRLYSTTGIPTRFGGAWTSPAYHGPQLMFEQRIHG